MRTLRILLLAGLPVAAWSQAVVEYGLGAAAAATAGAGAGANRGIAGTFSNLAKTLNTATGAKPAAATTAQPAQAGAAKSKAGTAQPAVPAAAQPAKQAIIYEDPAGIEKGMDQPELLRRFGEPAMKVTSAAGESLTYDA